VSATFRTYRGGGSPPEGGFELGVDLGPALPSDAPRLLKLGLSLAIGLLLRSIVFALGGPTPLSETHLGGHPYSTYLYPAVRRAWVMSSLQRAKHDIINCHSAVGSSAKVHKCSVQRQVQKCPCSSCDLEDPILFSPCTRPPPRRSVHPEPLCIGRRACFHNKRQHW